MIIGRHLFLSLPYTFLAPALRKAKSLALPGQTLRLIRPLLLSKGLRFAPMNATTRRP
jgi:hypothetical protein